MAVVSNTFEGGTVGDTLSSANSGGASGSAVNTVTPGAGGTVTYVADAYYRGKVACNFSPASGVQCFAFWDVAAARSGALTFRVKFAALPSTTGQTFLTIRTSGGTILVGLIVDNTGQILPIDNAGNPGTATSGSVAAGIWYTVRLGWSNPGSTTGTLNVNWYQGDNTTAISGLALALTGQSFGTTNGARLYFGKQSTANAWTGGFTIDDFVYQDSTTTPPELPFPTPDPYYVAQRSAVANVTGASTTVVTLPTGNEITVGNTLLIYLAVDNSGTSGALPGITSIVDTAGNTWTTDGSTLVDPGAASAGMGGYLLRAPVAHAVTATDTVTITWTTGSPAAKACVAIEMSNIDATSPVAVAAAANNGTGTSLSVSSFTPTAADQFVLGVAAIEGPAGDVFTLDSDTVDGTWKALPSLSTDTATAASNATVRAVCKRVTGTSAQTWNATITSRDWCALLIAYAPTAPPDESVPLGEVENIVATPSTTTRSVTITWSSVEHAVGYYVRLEELAPAGDPEDEGDWSTIAETTTDELGITLTHDDVDDIDWSDHLGVKVGALAE